MIQRLVALALRMPFIILSTAVIVILAGLAAYSDLDIEAYPNPVPPMVEVITQPDGWSAEEVERYVTVPLEIGLAGMKGLEHTRSQSLFGLSDVKCYFSWATPYDGARQEVINRIQFVPLANGMQAQLSPWNAIGELFRYEVVGKGYTKMDLKTAEDWILERQFKQVPGVIDVVSFGGETKEYHVGVDPFRLSGQGISLNQLEQGVQAANTNVGGQRLVIGEQAYVVRGVGLIQNLHDIENIVLAEVKGIPTRVRDVATASVGAAPRLGIVGHDDNPDIVQGVVLMRYGGETPTTSCRRAWTSCPTTTAATSWASPRTRCSTTSSRGCCWSRSSCSCSWGSFARPSSPRSTSRSRSSSRSSASSGRTRPRTSSRWAPSTSASSSTRRSS
jgi:cobalt-zinc-cadmium resistance protein CzcA